MAPVPAPRHGIKPAAALEEHPSWMSGPTKGVGSSKAWTSARPLHQALLEKSAAIGLDKSAPPCITDPARGVASSQP